MKYPSHTISKPVKGSAAKKVVAAVKEGKVIANAHSRATAARIAKQIVGENK